MFFERKHAPNVACPAPHVHLVSDNPEDLEENQDHEHQDDDATETEIRFPHLSPSEFPGCAVTVADARDFLPWEIFTVYLPGLSNWCVI